MANSLPSGIPNVITLLRAKQMTLRFRQNREIILDERFRGRDVLPFSETIEKTSLQQLIDNPECTAIRIYFGMDEQLRVHPIIVGVNSRNEDIIDLTLPDTTETGELLNDGVRCPPVCPPPSPLNEPI
ncbi:hypothetical protein EXU57_20310 [Segetibacter sp. 3557_3]|uniref:hypothetical protein n=1 Tax=Segetibacter sp. 3557_3 TaxID=2547429 RepID=UPI001058EACC|nr:hypothetical protein [Segetibacter sp. 3557_3]TDH21285.1 hypothetical protein EXU57_20310 [Segetibacter sp. 3557_3]